MPATEIDIPKDLEAILGNTGGLAPRYMEGQLVNPTPHIGFIALPALRRALERFTPQTDLELEYWSALYDVVKRGGCCETVEENCRVRRLEYEVYRQLGFKAEELATFYQDIF